MNDFLNIPLISPFKMYSESNTPGIHFDDDWTFNRIKFFETRVRYYQKWKRGDKTKIQVSTTAFPDDLKIYGGDGNLKKSIAFAKIMDAPLLGYAVYEVLFDIDSLGDGVYYLYIKSGTFAAISEAVKLANSWPNTLLFKYKNSYNDQGVTFITGIEYLFRCEAGIMDFQPDHDRASYINQTHDIKTLSSVPYRQYKLYIGDAAGVPPYVLDILNRIFGCNSVKIEGKQYETLDGAKWEVNRVKGYPHFGGAIDISEAVNLDSLQLNNVVISGGPGLAEAFDLDTDFFGGTNDVHIIEIQTN